MALDVLIGGTNLDANSNVKVTLPTLKAQAGIACLAVENDDGSITGSRYVKSPTVSENRKLATGRDTVLLTDSFNATAQNVNNWKSAATTLTFGFASGFVTFNNSGVTTTTTGQGYLSRQTVPVYGDTPLVVDFTGTVSATCPANVVLDMGAFNIGTFSNPFTPTDGIYIRLTSAGVFGVLNYAGTETSTGSMLVAATIPANQNVTFRCVITQEIVEFYYSAAGDFAYIGELAVPPGNGQPCSVSRLPIAIRYAQTGTAGAVFKYNLAAVTAFLQDSDVSMDFGLQMAGMGLMGYQGQNGGTLGTTALYTNSLAPGAGAVMTNTTAALGTGLGGQFAALPTLAANTDGILCSYLNPIGSTTQTPRAIVIKGVKIQGSVTTVLVGNATPVHYAYSLAFGHDALSLATSDGASTKAPRRIALGFESYAAAAAIGTLGQGVYMAFASPIVVNPGEYVAICAKNVGVVTTTGVITFLVTFDSHQM